ncbi:Tannase/feruloyl esterase [Xylariaceae sp. FL0255]|nr:Tannase/feruloyl esterase [Xylariaceae sp. FL0255]
MDLAAKCAPSAISMPTLFGIDVISIEAAAVHNFNGYVSDHDFVNNPEVFVEDATFCNITVTYTHPGRKDSVTVETWLPSPWNGRFQAVGSGGWTAGRTDLTQAMMSGAIAHGYATVTTDAGLGNAQVPHAWALKSPGNVDWDLLQNLASISLNEQALIGKHLIESYYGRPPDYSYFNGCSQGGRQGLQLAQRYPDAYDGIAAATPAVYWPQFFQAMLWPQLVMKETGNFPHSCELDFIQESVINYCDGNDGVIDGIIMDPETCDFNPFELVGTQFYCDQTKSVMELSGGAAVVVEAYHKGARGKDGKFLWYGPHWGANYTRTIFGSPGLVATTCEPDGSGCKGLPFPFSMFWMKFFAKKDATWSFESMTPEDFERTFKLAAQEYTSILGTADPDLSFFRDSGGKIITYQGLSDDIMPARSFEHYYKEVLRTTENTHDFYRYFEVPGLGHCWGGNGGHPNHVFEALRAWVENGTAPDSIPIDVPRLGPSQRRVICPYPQKIKVGAADEGGSTTFSCSV